MRRPPDNGQPALSERDVDTSNATLNTLFGVRQKAWMLGAGQPVRPTPRTNNSRTTFPPVAMVQQNTTTVLPSPAPSDEASPRISNFAVNGAGNGGRGVGHNDENRRPSITHPPQNRHPSHTFPSEADNQRRGLQVAETQSRPSSSSNRPRNQVRRREISPSPQLDDDYLQPSMTDLPPLPSSVLLPSYQHDQAQTPAGHLPSGQAQITGYGQVQSPIQLSSPTPPPPSPPRTQANNALSMVQGNGTSQGQSERRQLPSPTQTNMLSPRTTSDLPMPSTLLQNQTQSYPSPRTSNAPAPQKRQRTQTAAMPSLKPRIAFIDTHIEASGGSNNLNAGLEKPRFALLRDACNFEDSFYVALHQVFCVWDFDQNAVSHIPLFPEPHFLFAAFKIVGQLIRDNEQLAPNHKQWFATFPSPLNGLIDSSEPYRRVLADVGNFLRRLAVEWAPMTNECRARGYPPLVDELVNRLCLLSPILQGVVFTATIRTLGIGEGAIGLNAERLFRRDQYDHQALAARYNTNRPPTAKEVSERNNTLISEYLALQQQFLKQPRRTSSNPLTQMPTPVVPSNGHAHSGAQTSMPWQQGQQQHSPAWKQSMPSPNSAGNWQFSAQQPQMAGRATAGSPNPSIHAGRQPSVGPQQVYANNTPSPTLLQGLSMQSPTQQGFQFNPSARSNSGHMQSAPTGSVHPSGGNYQNGVQQMDPSMQQRSQMMMQQQQAAPQQGFASQQWQPNPQHQQRQASIQVQQQQLQQRQLQQQQLQQHALAQQVLNNRAAQLRQNSNGAVEPRAHSRTNSISSGGRRTPGVGPSPRPNPASLPAPGRAQAVRLDPRQAVQAYEQTPPINRPFVPPFGYSLPLQVAPETNALHQAHLRSPLLVCADASPINVVGDKNTRWYQTVRGFALDPAKIPSSTPLSKFDFRVSQADYDLIARDGPPTNTMLTTRPFARGTLQYRLRCVQAKKSEVTCSTGDWVVAGTVWPESASLMINKQYLEIRRANHHGKDLPIDITAFVREAGPNFTNRVALSITRGRTKLKEFSYFLAVEVVEILQHSQILEMCLQHRIPASQTLDKIKKSLDTSDEDDDIAMVSSDLSLDVADPHTAKIFEIPVRGNSCLHRECFDLETYLITRNPKPKQPHQPSQADTWKCPFCWKDARPYSLVVDDFLASVRATLAAQDNLDVKAIWVSADGSWRPKEIPRSSAKRSHPYDEDDSSDDEMPLAQRAAAPAATKKVVEIIELLDD